jgi:hypothetical protein
VRSDPAQAGASVFELRCEACGASTIVLSDHPGDSRAAAASPSSVASAPAARHRLGARHVAGAVLVFALLAGALTGYLWNDDHAARAARSSVGRTPPTAIAPSPVVAQPRFPG